MLSQEELKGLLNSLELDRVERTRSTSNTDKFCQAICAFANDFPDHRQSGYLLVGVDDDGSPSGIEVTDKLLLNLAAIRSDGNIQPLPAMTVDKRDVDDKEIVVVEVLPSDLPPVRYKGITWIRVGPRRAIATASEEKILTERRAARSRTFDASPCLECGIEELADDLFRMTYLPNAIDADALRRNDRSIPEQMASLRFFSLEDECATYAGALLFGKDVLRWLPGAYIQFVRFKGRDLTDDVETENAFSGDLLNVLRSLDSFVSQQIQRRSEPDSLLHQQAVLDYPRFAVREFLMNAVMHRSYDSTSPIRFYWFTDRIEIQSPGGLYPDATPENFPRLNAYRNPVVAEAMKALGYVERFGRGVLAAEKALEENGNPEAEFTFEPTHFLVTIRSKP